MKMRFTATLLLLVSGCLPGVGLTAAPAVQNAPRSAKPVEVEPTLQLTTEVVERKQYLSQYVGFTLRLTFKNIGNTPIILDKKCFLVSRLVSRDPEAAAAKRYESVQTFDYIGAVPPRNEPSRIDFVTLKPGGTYAFDIGIGSFKMYDGEGKPPTGQLGIGTHYLQVKVSTWSYLTDPAPFHRKWKRQGFLWYEGLTSQPMPFTVDIAP